jgi:branched-subunit amino acid aminotransferase/4-amino-4-deoxychorismate lyase
VRLELDELGRASLTPRALPAAPPRPVRVLLAEARANAANPFHYHKTTQRALYDRERQAALARGCFEVIFANQEGELTEGAISNLFLRTNEGWKTSPVTSGLLPGIWREHFLRETEAEETPLAVADLGTAQAVIIGNSVRGAVEVDEVLGPDGAVLYRRPQ